MTTPFGEWIKQRRRTLDLTQEQLSRQVEYSLITLQKLEAGLRRPSQQMLARLADCLQLSGEEVGRQILLADQGAEPSYLSWSPGGTFLLYTLFLGGGADIWWLDTRTGATGRLTTNGQSAVASWRRRCPTPNCQDPGRVFIPAARR